MSARQRALSTQDTNFMRNGLYSLAPFDVNSKSFCCQRQALFAFGERERRNAPILCILGGPHPRKLGALKRLPSLNKRLRSSNRSGAVSYYSCLTRDGRKQKNRMERLVSPGNNNGLSARAANQRLGVPIKFDREQIAESRLGSRSRGTQTEISW